jgi:fructuronate reductase
VRLSDATVARLPAHVARPDYDRLSQRIGIVHLGIGAFMRAHQAVFTDRAMAAGDRDWGIVGASLRSPAVRDTLAPQDGLFTVTENGADGANTRLIGSVRDVVVASAPNDALHHALVSPNTAIVTLTVTEKGYHRRADGSLDLAAVEQAGGTIYHTSRGHSPVAAMPGSVD